MIPRSLRTFCPRQFPQNHDKSQVFSKSVDLQLSGKQVNVINSKNGFGCEISASGLRHHIRRVAQVCLLPISAHKPQNVVEITCECMDILFVHFKFGSFLIRCQGALLEMGPVGTSHFPYLANMSGEVGTRCIAICIFGLSAGICTLC